MCCIASMRSLTTSPSNITSMFSTQTQKILHSLCFESRNNLHQLSSPQRGGDKAYKDTAYINLFWLNHKDVIQWLEGCLWQVPLVYYQTPFHQIYS
jgi:hypothetical protein